LSTIAEAILQTSCEDFEYVKQIAKPDFGEKVFRRPKDRQRDETAPRNKKAIAGYGQHPWLNTTCVQRLVSKLLIASIYPNMKFDIGSLYIAMLT
jgi:hypothetical protein